MDRQAFLEIPEGVSAPRQILRKGSEDGYSHVSPSCLVRLRDGGGLFEKRLT
jgi:hypothetical protein